jgi:hypothetical protein
MAARIRKARVTKGSGAPLHLGLPALLLLGACRVGGAVTGGTDKLPDPQPDIDMPTVSYPSANPYYSREDSIIIAGLCGVGQEVRLRGAESQSQTCGDDSTFRFVVLRSVDGVYALSITQTDFNGTVSEAAPLTWIRKTSVSPPSVSEPAASPYLSGKNTLRVSGSCETGALITLEGDGSGRSVCANSSYSISVAKAADGNYDIDVVQTDPAGNSATTSIEWRKHALTVSPLTPTLQVADEQVLSISGGSGIYEAEFEENLSGGTYNNSDSTYTAGTVAGVTDILLVTDSLGDEMRVELTTVGGLADHLELSSAPSIEAPIGEELDEPLAVRVVDRYGNGVAAVSVYFKLMLGDARFGASARQTSDADGLIEMPLRLGLSSRTSRVRVEPLGPALPDLASSGTPTLSVDFTATATGQGTLLQSFATAADPASVKAADVNGDGVQDLLVLNAGTASLGVLLGRGDGNVDAIQNFSLGLCSSPNDLVTGNFNDDAFLDVAVSCQGSDTLARMVGNGTGAFSSLGAVVFIASPSALLAHDLNGDGQPDLVAASTSAHTVNVLLGSDDFSFGAPVSYAVADSPLGLALGDVDGDSVLDLAVAGSADGTLDLLLGESDGTFNAAGTSMSGAGAQAVVLRDFNEDGHLDAAVLNPGENTVAVFLNDESGSLLSPTTFNVGNESNRLLAADFDEDGNLDIVVVNAFDATLGLLKGSGTGTFDTMVTTPLPGAPSALASFDANGDSHMDFAVTSIEDQAVRVIIGDGSGGFGLELAAGLSAVASISADFDGDEHSDLVVASAGSNALYVYKGAGTGKQTFERTLATGISPTGLVVADLDGDGLLDLATSNQGSNSVTLYRGHAVDGFTSRSDFAVAASPSALVAGDFNNDGRPDLVVAGSSSSVVSILLADEEGSFAPKADYPSGSSPADLVAADFNGDGALDLATADTGSDTISLMLGNGDGSFRSPIATSAGTSPIKLLAEDFNRDAVVDVASLNSGDGSVSILRGAGDGSFLAPNVSTAGGEATDFVAADFNGDGFTDLAVSNGSLNSVTYMPSTAGLFSSTVTFDAPAAIGSLGLIDANGDHAADLVLMDPNDGKVWTWIAH